MQSAEPAEAESEENVGGSLRHAQSTTRAQASRSIGGLYTQDVRVAPMKFSSWCLVLVAGCGGAERDAADLTIVLPNAPDAQIAYRDGDGPWAEAPTASTVELSIESGRYTVAIGCPTVPVVDVYQATLDELSTLTYDKWCRPMGEIAVSVQLQNVGSSGYDITWSDATLGWTNSGGMPTSFNSKLPEGTHDLIATRKDFTIADRIIFVRDYAAGVPPAVEFDFEGPNAIELERVQLGQRDDTDSGITTSLITADGTSMSLGWLSTGFLMAVPEASLAPGDLHMLVADGTANALDHEPRVAKRVARTLPTTFELPSRVTARPTVSSQLPLVAQWAPFESALAYRFSIANWAVHVSSAEFVRTERIAVPDLEELPSGWATTYGFTLSIHIRWWMHAEGGAALEDLWRNVPVREHDAWSTGWTEQMPM